MKVEYPVIFTPKQQKLILSDAYENLVDGNKGGGKLTSLDTIVPTITGKVTMANIKAGDKIFDDKGNICNVLKAHEIVESPESYELIFDDGTTIKACAEHLWHTYTHKERRSIDRHNEEFRAYRRDARIKTGEIKGQFNSPKPQRIKKTQSEGSIRTTKEIYNTQKIKFKSDKFITNNHSIRMQLPINTSHKELDVHPYILGVWLGDGSKNSSDITGIDMEIFEYIESKGYKVNHSSKHKKKHSVQSLITKLKKIGVNNNKHIPDIYLRSSYSQRLELLKGLMDTDGYCNPKGRCQFDNTNKRLIDDVYELLMTLGIKATRTEKDAKLNGRITSRTYRINFYTTLPVFHLPRKLNRLKKKENPRHKWRYIVEVKKIEPVPMRCITVDSESKLYLCSESFIPTHNTLAVVSRIYYDCMKYRNARWIFFRRTLPEARETFMKYALEFYPKGTYQIKIAANRIIFPTGSACLMGHIENDRDLSKYQGLSFHRVAFDEATTFTPKQIGYIKAQIRSTNKDMKPQIFYSTNPGGVSHGWFKERFVDNKEPFQKYETPESISRRKLLGLGEENAVYLMRHQMMLDDNPFLLEADPEYKLRLDELPEDDKPALRDGSWEILSGQFFKFHPEHKIKEYKPTPNDNIFISCDWGTNKPFAIYWHAVTPEEHIITYREFYGISNRGIPDDGCNMTAEEVAVKIIEYTPKDEIIRYMVLDTACWTHDGHGMSIYEIMQDVLKHRNIFIQKATKDRVNGWEVVKKYMKIDKYNGIPFWQITENCVHFWRTMPYMLYDDKIQGDINTDCEDHCCDSCRYYMMSRPMPKRLVESLEPPMFSMGWLQKQQNKKQFPKIT